MKKYVHLRPIIVCIIFFLNIFDYRIFAEGVNDEYTINMKRDVLTLMMAYPEYVIGVTKGEENKVYVVMKSGQKILYDDKKTKSTLEKENHPDLQDMLEQVYPLNNITDIMPKDFDPGRIRVYSILSEVYGESEKSIEKNLVNVNIGRSYQFNQRNNAATSLQNAIKEIVAQSKGTPRIGGFLYPMSGTFNYRRISGTGRLSPHSYGIAIDLKSDRKDYWKWASREEGKKRLNVYPREIVKAFEENNFIWGGKWSHFDILHFEYRPEFIIKAKYFSDKCKEGDSWYKGVPLDNEDIKTKINIIDSQIS
jgi:hypothetical protein